MKLGILLVLVGTGLAVFGVLSFEHDVTGPDAHPIATVMYPVWAKAMTALGTALLASGLIWSRRKSN